MNLKIQLWKVATALVVILIILNSEMIGLALFIDAIGLEMFLMLLEVQVLAIFSVFVHSKIKPALVYSKRLFASYRPALIWENISKKPSLLVYSIPSQAALMHTLVFSALIGVVFNAI